MAAMNFEDVVWRFLVCGGDQTKFDLVDTALDAGVTLADVLAVVAPDAEQSALITDASVAHALNSTFSDTEVEAALNALGVKINLIIDALIAAGIVAAA